MKDKIFMGFKLKKMTFKKFMKEHFLCTMQIIPSKDNGIIVVAVRCLNHDHTYIKDIWSEPK